MGQLGLHRGLRTKGRSHTPRMSSHLEDVGRGQGARCSPAWSRKGGQLGAQRGRRLFTEEVRVSERLLTVDRALQEPWWKVF